MQILLGGKEKKQKAPIASDDGPNELPTKHRKRKESTEKQR